MKEWPLSIDLFRDDEGDEAEGPPPAEVESAFKDEMNLAEFPIAALTDRVPDGQTTLVFEDRLDQRDGPPIVRRLTIMAPSKHGLPAAVDDEVIVGLIQLTKRRNNFTDPKVQFSRYELIDLLGWPQTGPSYRRIEEALHRWVGVVLVYENAWWDNQAKSWVDESFHILENVSLYDRERKKLSAGKKPTKKAKKTGVEGDPLPLSAFRWNEVIFRSFQSGNLKQLDLDFYLQLRLPTTKRMFRFLDKRFYRRERLDFDLKTLACEHIGMSRSYAPTELKQRAQAGARRARGARVPGAALARGAVFLGLEGVLPDPADPGSSGPHGAPEFARRRGRRTDRRAGHPGRRPAIGGRPGQDAPAEPGPDEARSLRLARQERGQAGRQEPRRLPRRLDPRRLHGARRILADLEGRALARPRPPSAPGPPRPTASAGSRPAARPRPPRPRRPTVRARWDALPLADRESITARVQAENPGLRRWKAMLEPLCLAELDRQIASGERKAPSIPAQKTLFDDVKAGR